MTLRERPVPRTRSRAPAPAWLEYERRKREFLRDCAGATPQAYERFIRQLGKKLGV